jgi:hypothetical protein
MRCIIKAVVKKNPQYVLLYQRTGGVIQPVISWNSRYHRAIIDIIYLVVLITISGILEPLVDLEPVVS